MHQSVKDHFIQFTSPLEGRVHWMYLDVLGLVTTAIGDLIDGSQSRLADPASPALSLPWQVDGRKATEAEVRADWHAVKSRPELAHQHFNVAKAFTLCRLD